MAEPFGSEIGQALYRLFKAAKYTDCKVKCGISKKTWMCHKVILSGRSKFFSAAFESRFAEAESNLISLPEESLKDVEKMLQYMYTGDYPSRTIQLGRKEFICSCSETHYLSSLDTLEELEVHVDMYALADRLEITGLKDVAAEKFKAFLKSHPTVWEKVLLSGIAEKIYTTTPTSDRLLRQHLCGYLASNPQSLRAVVDKKELKDIVNGIEGLAMDVLAAQLRRRELQRCDGDDRRYRTYSRTVHVPRPPFTGPPPPPAGPLAIAGAGGPPNMVSDLDLYGFAPWIDDSN